MENIDKNTAVLKELVILITILILVGCQVSPEEGSVFKHQFTEGSKPWSHENFNNRKDQFTFAIISDLNGGEREGIFDVAMEQLNLLKPEFIMSVGDLINGGTEDRDQLKKEWDSFDERALKASAPIFHVGGNHDLTNVVMREVWEERYGRRYYHFVYKNVLFLVLDSEDYQEDRMQEIYLARAEAIKILDGPEPEKYQDSEYYSMPERTTGEISDPQSAYFEEVLAQYPDVRWTVLFMHKPVWRREEGRNMERIEAALGDRPYTVFNGHFHTYSHTKRNGRDYVMLGTTGGSQNSQNEESFDHIALITMTSDGPSIANLKLEGILDITGQIPGGGEGLCFQASECAEDQ